MSGLRQVAQGSIALLASNGANKIIGFLIMLSVARFLGAEPFGIYTFVFSYVWLFSMMTDLGLTSVVAGELSRDEDSGRLWLGNTLLMRGAVSAGAYLLCLGSAVAANGWTERTALIAISGLTFFYAPWSTAQAVLTARMKLAGAAIVSLASRLMLLAGVQVLARIGAPLSWLITLEVLLGALTTGILWLWASSLVKPRYHPAWDVQRQLLAQGIPLFLTSLFIAFYFRLDVFFLEYFVGSLSIGIYAAAYRLTEAVPMAAAAFANNLFPWICRLRSQGERERHERLVRSAQKVLLAGVVPIVLILSGYALPVVNGLYGGRYDEAAVPLAILVWAQVFAYSNVLSTTLLVSERRGRILMWVTLGMLGANILLNFLFIPRFGAPGAAATTVATECVGCLALLHITRSWAGFARALVRVAPAAATGALVLLGFLRWWPEGFTWQVPALLGIYAAALLIFPVFSREEWAHLKRTG